MTGPQLASLLCYLVAAVLFLLATFNVAAVPPPRRDPNRPGPRPLQLGWLGLLFFTIPSIIEMWP